jgi:hypothetical protein
MVQKASGSISWIIPKGFLPRLVDRRVYLKCAWKSCSMIYLGSSSIVEPSSLYANIQYPTGPLAIYRFLEYNPPSRSIVRGAAEKLLGMMLSGGQRARGQK